MEHSFKSAIEFGLVYIPITLYACIKNNDIGFNMLYKKTKQRIKYQKTCADCPANISSSDIIKGYEYEPDQYITLTEEEIEKIKSPKDKSISITEFVDLDEIDPIYYEKSYYVAPVGADKAFAMLLKALEAENKVGIAKTVLGSKEQVVGLRVVNGRMILNTMYFYDEVQVSPVKLKDVKIGNEELALARNLIRNLTKPFVAEDFKNEYRAKLMEAIQAKIKGESIKTSRRKAMPNNVISLMDALQKSVAQTEKKPTKSKTKQKA